MQILYLLEDVYQVELVEADVFPGVERIFWALGHTEASSELARWNRLLLLAGAVQADLARSKFPTKTSPGLQLRIDNENCREGGGLTVQFSRCVACSSSIVGRCSLLGIDQSSPLYCPKKNQKTRANLRLPHPHARAPMQVSPSQFASPAAVLSEVQNVIDAHGGASEFALALICHIASVLNWHGKPWSPELW